MEKRYLDEAGLAHFWSKIKTDLNDVINGYPVAGAEELSRGWLSMTPEGAALIPQKDKIYILMATTDNYTENTQFLWNGLMYASLADAQVGVISNSDIESIMSI